MADKVLDVASPLQESKGAQYSGGGVRRLGPALLFLFCGLAVFLLGSPYFSLFPTNKNPAYLLALTMLFLAGALMLKRSDRFRRYQPVAYAFFIASCANLALTLGVFNFIIQGETVAQDIATDKLAQFLAIVPLILILTKAAGDDLGSIFLRRGRLRAGLTFGVISFVLFALLALLLYSGSDIGPESLFSAGPWILLFVFANSLMEELWFRGIFLKRFEPFIGVGLSVLVTTVVFAAGHLGATYVSPAELLTFLVQVSILGLVTGYAMFKTDSIWGSVLFHAGADLIVIVPIIQSLA